ncbi:MAG: ribonuclease H-like domain-containing protein [Euryarchaeota archaeon]|nr:ribonuclease H-like domain-containing protein [Euryarchaeota archaeon]
MLRNSFIFLPGVGAKTERRLWGSGISDWAKYLSKMPAMRLPAWQEETHRELLETASAQLVAGNPRLFALWLPNGEHWRALKEFGQDAAFLDIETTGMGKDADITVIGIHSRRGTTQFVRGRDLTRRAVSADLARYKMFVTFNGSQFDIPAMRTVGIRFPKVPHADLRFGLARLGLRGGLKRIEDQVGMGREGDVKGLTGYDAVKMWQKWERNGDSRALELLLEYNRADIENLPKLAKIAYDGLKQLALTGLE